MSKLNQFQVVYAKLVNLHGGLDSARGFHERKFARTW